MDSRCRDLALARPLRSDVVGRRLHVRHVLPDVAHVQRHEGDDAARGRLLALRRVLIFGPHLHRDLCPGNEGEVGKRNSSAFSSQIERERNGEKMTRQIVDPKTLTQVKMAPK